MKFIQRTKSPFGVKTKLTMRLTTMLLLFSLFRVSGSTYSQNTKIDLHLENASILDVFNEIEKNTEFVFFYRDAQIDLTRKVSIDVDKERVKNILKFLFSNTNVSYEVVDKQIVLNDNEKSKTRHNLKGFGKLEIPSGIEEDQQLTITGTVSDKSDLLPGVNIIIVGTTKGAETDFDGKYTIKANRGDVLKFSFVGMKPATIKIGDKTTINVVLEAAPDGLDEVVIVGFGSQKKESVVGSISTVKPSELKVPSSNLTTALAGRISGVVAYQTSGEPGSDNAKFFVRGITTFAQGAGPLILIDGVELTADDLSRLQTDDIESFSVLKDATSTAVYGARGANGIILVTTKKGVIGKARVSVRYETSVSSNIQVPDFVNAIDYMNGFNEAVRTRRPGTLIPFSEEKIFNTRANTNPNVFPAVDWQDQLIKDQAINQRLNFNVRGGGKVAQYYVSASLNKDNGILKQDTKNNLENNIDLKRYLLRANISVKLSKSTEAVVRLHSTLDEFKGPAVNAGTLFTQTLLTSPVRFPAVYEPDAANAATPNILFGNQRIGGNQFYVNPYHQLVSGFTQSSRALALVQVELKQDLSGIMEGLRVRFLGNNNRTSNYALRRSSLPFFYQAELFNYDPVKNSYALTRLNDDGNRALSFNGGSSEVFNVLYGELALNYDRTFGNNTVSGLLVGIGREASRSTAESLSQSLPARNIGISGRFTYDYDSKYFAEFNFGYNGSERFDKNNRFGFFPSIGAAWLISNERFFDNMPSSFISRLKLRASYGIVGNDALGGANDRFFYRSQVNLNDGRTGYRFGGDFIPGVTIGNYENTAITWERAKTMNLGLELDLFDSALKIKAEYFTQLRDNILQTRLTPTSLGLQAPNRDNVGIAYTKGIDLSIDGNKTFNDNFWIAFRGNFTYSNGRYDRFEEPDYSLRNAPFRAITGTKINQQVGYIAERLFIDEEEVANSPVQNFGNRLPLAGDIKYKDINGDGQINDLDRVPIGKPTTPQITYGAGFSLGYKNIDVSIFFQGNAEVSVFVDPNGTAPFIRRTRDEDQLPGVFNRNSYTTESTLLQAYSDDHWTETNRNPYAFYPRLSDQIEPNNTQLSTWWLKDAAFLRLKQIEVGFNLKDLEGIESMRIYASGTNLATWTKFKLWDPEVGGNGFGYPLQRVFNLGILFNF